MDKVQQVEIQPSLSELRESCRLRITDTFDAPPVMLRIDESIVGTLGNFSASTGKAKSKKTFNICAIAAAALVNGSVLNYRVTLPDHKRNERQIHIHTVLHLNKGDDNTRGHLGTELNNKAETVLQITKDEFEKDMVYRKMGYSFGLNKAKDLKIFLENKRMIVKENKLYRFNVDFVF